MKIITRISLALLALACLQANAAATTTTPPDDVIAAGTDYSTLATDTFIDLGPVMEPMEMADMLMCIVTASGAPLLPNETYLATADFGLCGAGGSQQAVYSGMTVESSRTSDSAPQDVNMWIQFNLDSSPIMDIEFKAQLTSAPTPTNHLGVWQVDWEFQNPGGPNNIEHGHMKAINGASGFSEFTMVSHAEMSGDEPTDISSKILMTSLTDGFGRLKETTDSGDKDFALAFNNSFVIIEEAGAAASCHNIESFTDTVYEYNLYDSAGALVDINTQIEFITSTGGRGVMGSYSHWIDNQIEIGYWVWLNNSIDYPSSSIDTIVTKADDPETQYTLSWAVEVVGDSKSHTLTAVADGRSAGPSFAHAFDKPIYFDTRASELDSTVSPLTDRNDNADSITRSDFENDELTYNGAGRLWGIVSDSMALADGTELTSKSTGNDATHSNKKYYVKAASVGRTPDTAVGECSSLNGALGAAKQLVLPLATEIQTNRPALGTEPTITASPRIIDGALVD